MELVYNNKNKTKWDILTFAVQEDWHDEMESNLSSACGGCAGGIVVRLYAEDGGPDVLFAQAFGGI